MSTGEEFGFFNTSFQEMMYFDHDKTGKSSGFSGLE